MTEESNNYMDYAEDADQAARIMIIGCGPSGVEGMNEIISQGIEDVVFAVIADETALSALAHNSVTSSSTTDDGFIELLKEITKQDLLFLSFRSDDLEGLTIASTLSALLKKHKDCPDLTLGVTILPKYTAKSDMTTARLQCLADNIDQLIFATPTPEDVNCSVAEHLSCTNAATSRATCQYIKSITEMITLKGLICFDFADMYTIFTSNTNTSKFGGWADGSAKGEKAAKSATAIALDHLSETFNIKLAKGVMISLNFSAEFSIEDVSVAANIIQDKCAEEAQVFFTAYVDEKLTDEFNVRVILISTELEI